MATSGSIQTLFKDREQTEAIFPRTKVRAVTDDDGNRLDVILEDVVHIGDKVIDTSSVPVNVDTLGGIPAEDYATEAWVKNEIANVQAGEDVDLSGFASQDDITLLNRRIDELDYPVDSVNGKTGAVVLNAEDVGAHPNTWMPTASDVGARPDTWMPTPEQIGAAPASGFESRNSVASVEDLNALIETLVANQPVGTEKTYYCTLSWYANAPLPTGRWSITIHKPDVYSEPTWAGVTATVIASQRIHHLQRELYEGTWLDWEWENPSMVLGAEYRTTERWQGKAVYAKMVNVGTTSKGTQTIPHGISATEAIRCAGMFPNAAHGTFPYDDGTNKMHIHADKTNFTITANIAGIEVYATIWYTKD